MSWWLVLVLGWIAIAVPLSLWLGLAARAVRTDEERAEVLPPSVQAHDVPVRSAHPAGRRLARLPRPRGGRVSAGQRAEPRR